MPRQKRSSAPPKIHKREIKRYGWVPDIPDHRDLIYAAPGAVLKALPPKVDLRAHCPPVYNQGQLGSCTANAIGGALEFDQIKQRWAKPFVPSRLFIYYNERVMEGTVDEDSGAMIRDGVKSVAKLGAPPELPDWPYNILKFRYKPSPKAYRDARKHPAVLYQRLVRDANQLKGCLADGYVFVFGISVYESFETRQVATTGRVPMPKPRERALGGHAIMAVGYDDSEKRFIVRNSWGDKWGVSGYFTLPYAYVLDENLSDDFWTIKIVK